MNLKRILRNAAVGALKAVLIITAYEVFHGLVPPQLFTLAETAAPVSPCFFAYTLATLTFIGNLFSGSLLKYFVDFAKGLFVTCFFILSSGTASVSIHPLTVEINATALMAFFAAASMLNLSQTVMCAIDYLAEKT